MTIARSRIPVLAVRLGVALATLLAFGDPAIAQQSPLAQSPFSSALGIGGHAGWLKSGDADNPNLYGGAHVRLRLLPILGLEGSVDYRREEFDNGAVELRSYPVLVSALLYPFRIGPLEPYVIGGVGWYFSRIEIRGGPDDETNRFGAHVGAGADIPITPQFVIHADIRYIFYDVDSETVREARFRDLDTDGWLATVGATFYFR